MASFPAPNTRASSSRSGDTSASAGARRLIAAKSAQQPAAIRPAGTPSARAAGRGRREQDRRDLAGRIRECAAQLTRSRWPYSSQRISSSIDSRLLLSVPMASRPPARVRLIEARDAVAQVALGERAQTHGASAPRGTAACLRRPCGCSGPR